MTEVASTVQYGERRSQTPDSIDRELDWMINRDPHSSSNQYDEPQNTQGADQTSPDPAEDKPTDFYEQRDHFDRDDMASPENTSGANQTETLQKSESPTPVEQSTESKSPPSSPSRSPPQSPPRSTSRSPTSSPAPQSDTDEDHLAMTESQRQANAELETMKLDLGYTEEDPPDYDVADRVRQLNEELANDPSPDQDRERSIKFKENLVDLVAPPPDLPTDDEEGADDQAGKRPRDPKASTDKADEKVDSPRDQSSGQKIDDIAATPRDQTPSPVAESDRKGSPTNDPVDSVAESEEDSPRKDDSAVEYERDYSVESGDDATPRSPSPTTNNQDSSREESKDEKILVERNGKFELLNASELTPEERELYCVPPPEDDESEANKGKHEPKPPSEPRPQTVNDTGASRKSNHSSQRRTQSAQGYNEWDENFTYESPYAMTPEYRRELAKKRQEEQRKEKEDRDKNSKEQEQKSRDNNDAFEGWLRKKKEQIRQENQEKGDQKEGEEERDPEGAYEGWSKAKKEESKKQRDEEKKRQKECDEGWYVRPREDCDKAFKQWLSKKNADLKKQKNDEKQKARIHKLLARRSRKSQQLARAIRQAQAYRYVDYYGYRF